MRKYINAELQIVRLNNDVIATSTRMGIGNAATAGFQMQSGERLGFDDDDEFDY